MRDELKAICDELEKRGTVTAGPNGEAIPEPDVIEQSAKETGLKLYTPATSPIEAMVDKATGFNHEGNLNAFAMWATKELWGQEYAPAKMREALAKASDNAS